LAIPAFSLKKLNSGFQFALGEVYLFMAPFAGMFFIEFVGKNLGFFSATGAFTGK
jgi:hypothetical protein